jgi:hypothetical protein
MGDVASPKPDFSGEWQLNLQASTLSPIVAPAAQSGVLRIEHHEPRFSAHQTIVLGGKPFESKFELLSDLLPVRTAGPRAPSSSGGTAPRSRPGPGQCVGLRPGMIAVDFCDTRISDANQEQSAAA